MTVAYACTMVMLYRAVWVKNLLICAGAYYLARWVTLPLAFGFGKLTGGITYSGDFEGGSWHPRFESAGRASRRRSGRLRRLVS
jgi:hypothetical protein